MRIVIIGEPCIDVIHKADGRVYNEPGGISYSVVASAALNTELEVVPVIGLHEDDRSYFTGLFDNFQSIDQSAIYRSDQRTRRVDLFYEDENNRWECSTQPIRPTNFSFIKNHLPAEGIFVNLISGEDITVETLERIRKSAPASHLHIDLHNIVMSHLPDGKRVRVPVGNYLQWCSLADTIQMNEEEAAIIDDSSPSMHDFAAKVLSCGPHALVVTLAERGSVLFEKIGKEIKRHDIAPVAASVVDPTGSGDVYGAAFLQQVIQGSSYPEAARYASAAASMKVKSAGPASMINWKAGELNV